MQWMPLCLEVWHILETGLLLRSGTRVEIPLNPGILTVARAYDIMKVPP